MKYLKYFESKLIYKTHRGEIYQYGNKILKITKDIIEYNNALILINYKLIKKILPLTEFNITPELVRKKYQNILELFIV